MLSFLSMIYTMKEKVIESFLLSSTLMDDTGQLVLNVNIQNETYVAHRAWREGLMLMVY